VLTDNKDKLTTLAERLLEKEVIFKEDLEKIFGVRNFEKDILALENKKNLEKLKDSDSNLDSDSKTEEEEITENK
jgi:cell division protease FtsH